MAAESVQELAERLRALSIGDQLRLAAGLMDAGRSDVASVIVDFVHNELTLLKLFGKHATCHLSTP